MSKRIVMVLLLWVITQVTMTAAVIKGVVYDGSTGESLIGASVTIEGTSGVGAVTGLDGSFTIKTDGGDGAATLICRYVGFAEARVKTDGQTPVVITMSESATGLQEVVVKGQRSGSSDNTARLIERRSMNVVNVLSGRAMELSPDVTVGNMLQRMSGVSIERNSSGEGSYALLRGMDKRYNYTLVNGIKIPSPDNKNRFVPLDLFPSDILERLEVYKSPTANLEGDGIGGAINLVMKDAPDRRLLSVHLSTGYNALFFDRDFLSFDHRSIATQSPNEIKGVSGDYGVTVADFTNKNLRVNSHRPLPDLLAGATYGDRFFGRKLGVVASIDFQNMHRGKNSDWYYRSSYAQNGVEYRTYNDARQRLSAHAKLDYDINGANEVCWYNGYLDVRDTQTRVSVNDNTESVRLRHNVQGIFNSTLSGRHSLLANQALTLTWTGAYSRATNETPDNAEIYLQGMHIATSTSAVRRWEHNSDRDWSGYAMAAYLLKSGDKEYEFNLGGMYRDKRRNSFFNEYTFDSATGIEHPQVYGVDWTNFDQIDIVPREYGNVGDPLNYDALERIGAGFLSAKMSVNNFEFIAGLRAEHTNQGYTLKFPRDVDPEGYQTYTDWLPDAHIKYAFREDMNVKISYYRAINRPGFFEIVPYSIITEEYKERGNPSLKHTSADNVDLRWEYFPSSSEQVMAGAFFKHLQNPIEYGLITEGQDSYYMPLNLGNATNMGLEIDVLKYFNRFGIKANYTYTHSAITTDKRTMQGNEIVVVKQTRPLAGQAAHVANLSLLYKDTRNQWEAQLTTSYIGKRLCEISNWLDNDIWENDYVRLELSAEKTWSCGLSVFLKATNLLNLPLVRYIHKGEHTDAVVDAERTSGGDLVERKERYGQTIQVGVRFKL
ncbi:MAG: TonB-dependent receptor domain-containing protein [Muribaculaceae bacterium]